MTLPKLYITYCIVGLYRLFGLSVIIAYPFCSLYQIYQLLCLERHSLVVK